MAAIGYRLIFDKTPTEEHKKAPLMRGLMSGTTGQIRTADPYHVKVVL